MKHWLIKSEPETWSWQQQEEKKDAEAWDGVRSYQANNNMKAMKLGDLALFYHSGKEKRIMGVVKIVRTFYPDITVPPFGCIDVQAYGAFRNPVSLARIKAQPSLATMVLVKNSRLSVQPVEIDEFQWVVKEGQWKNA